MNGNITKLEEQRALLQRDRDGQRSQVDRNRMGQFATPYPLARQIIQESLALLPVESRIRFLDPAFGTGSFYSALLDIADHRISSACGFEIDPHYGDPARRLWRNTKLELKIADFTDDLQDHGKVNLLVCNPPYVR